MSIKEGAGSRKIPTEPAKKGRHIPNWGKRYKIDPVALEIATPSKLTSRNQVVVLT
jgi:hypothetical protein